MKDYIAEIENKKRKQKIWTAVLVVSFMLISVAILLFSDVIKDSVVQTKADEQNKELIDSTSILNSRIDEKIQDSISTAHVLKENVQTVPQVDSQVEEQIKEVNEKIDAAQKKTDELLAAAQRLNNQTPTVESTTEIKQIKRELVTVQRDLQRVQQAPQAITAARRNDNYTVFIIYMKDLKEAARNAKEILTKDMKLEKFEEMDKFAYNMSIRYFNDKDEAKAKNLKSKLDEKLNVNFELRQLNLPSPDNTIEVWIGKK